MLMGSRIIRLAILLVPLGLTLGGCSLPLAAPDLDGLGVPPLGATATYTPFQPLSLDNLEATFTAWAGGESPPLQATPGVTDPQGTVITPAELESPTAVEAHTTATAFATSASSPAPEPPVDRLTLWIDPQLPAALREALNIPPEVSIWEAENATVRLEAGSDRPVSHWIYALVAPFPTVPYGVPSDDLIRNWRGEWVGTFAGLPLLMDESAYHMLRALWGEAADGAVQVLPSQELLSRAWEQRPSWAIVPFEAVEPGWKVLEVDGQSPVRNDFDPTSYALNVPVSLNGDQQAAELLISVYGAASGQEMLPASNRDPERLTVLAMSGVTALVRATAYTMEQNGVLYPGIDVRDWLRSADLTHISNEVAFAKNCPYPDPVQQSMRFCSDPRYIALLEDVGTDIVELTGDHLADWGTDAMYYTLDLYRERGWPYYGGGENLDEGRRAITLEHNGNRLAFIGCNAKGGSFAQAGADRPGAAACDLAWMAGEVTRLRGEGYLPIVTFQHFEYYTYRAHKPQIRDARAMAEAGAAIVSGSQAHQPQAFEFNSGSFIHHGLGNLFFDQYEVSYPTRQGFIDRHVFYEGRHISTELLPILFIDYARPRPMTPQERVDLLNSVFSASGW